MKAIVCTKYGPPAVLQLQDVAKPSPRSAEVLIKVFATAVTVSDCIIRGFKVARKYWIPMGIAIGFTKPRRPGRWKGQELKIKAAMPRGAQSERYIPLSR